MSYRNMEVLILPKVVVLIAFMQSPVRVAGYSTCWDGTLAYEYTGTKATTAGGKTCQPWADNSPHIHTFHDAWMFPFDGSDVSASNYCRDAASVMGTSGTWCYTMDAFQAWDYCDIPLCWNLPCTAGLVVGSSNPALLTASVDANSGTNYLLQDSGGYRVSCCGTVQEWKVYLSTGGTIRLQIWREVAGSYQLLGENVGTHAAGNIAIPVSQNDRISVEQDDHIGWYTTSDLVTYDTGSTNNNLLLSSATPSIGDTVDFGPATARHGIDYAIGLLVADSVAPYFTNVNNEATTPETTAIGDPVFTLTYTDDDPDDVAGLVLAINANTYFDLSGDDVVVKATLAVGVETLDVTVTDHCGRYDTFQLTVNITAVPVTITNLPDTTSVSESTTLQTSLQDIVVVPAWDTYSCVIDSYLPTRPEGNPFIIASTATADNGIYLAAAANVRHNTASQLNVTVTCSNSGNTDSDTSFLVVNVDPNSQPTFSSFVSSTTFSARSTSTNDVVYTATVTDAESDPITMSIIIVPAGGPFDVNNAGEVYATADLSLHQQATYDVILTADDGFNSVNSSTISFVISDINALPVFTNLPGPAPDVDENQSVGTSVFQVSSTDADGDSVIYSATYSNTDCAALFDIDAGGLVTTKVVFDYETLTTFSCIVMVSAFDGYGTFDHANLTVDVADVDEPPVMSGSAFTIVTEEVVDNTALPDQGISATDPEGAAVTLTKHCGADDGHISIDATTGIVTMTTAIDLELLGVDTYTILCTVTATDATSMTSTASLTVSVTDANDETPYFLSGTFTTSLLVGHSVYGTVLTVSAADDDRTSPNNLVTFTLDPVSAQFDIGLSGGNIYNTADLSSDASGTSYALTVKATDGGTPPLSAITSVTIYITSTTTTVATTAATGGGGSGSSGSGSASASGSGDFFDSTGNIVLLALVCFLTLLVSVMLGLFIWRYCAKNAVSSEHLPRFRTDKAKLSRQAKPSEVPKQKPRPYISSDSKSQPSQNGSLSKSYTSNQEQDLNYHRPIKKIMDIPRDRFPSNGIEMSPRVVTPAKIQVSTLADV